MKLKLLITIFTLFSTSLIAKEKQEIFWLTDDQNDIKHLLSSRPFALDVDTNNMVLSRLENFQISPKFAQIPRINQLLKTNKNYCVGNRIKTPERAKDNLFSSPIHYFPSIRLYYLTGNIEFPKELMLEPDTITSLKAVFDQFPNKKLVVSLDRSYGNDIDKELAQVEPNNLVVRLGGGMYEGIYKMLINDRVDFILAYPTDMKRQALIHNTKVSLSSVSIANSKKYIKSHFACSKTQIGHEFISQVNSIMKELYKNPEYFNTHLRYINDNEHEGFKNYYKATLNANF